MSGSRHWQRLGCRVAATRLGLTPYRRRVLTMPISMYTVSIPVFIRHLNGLDTVLDKASAWAAARKVNETDLLNMRLSPDMLFSTASKGGYRSRCECSGAFIRQR